MKLKAAHNEAVYGVYDKQTSFAVGFNLFQRFLYKVVSLTEVRSLLVNEHLLLLLKLSLIHEIISE